MKFRSSNYSNGNLAMTKSQFCSTILLAFAMMAVTSSSAFAAPQDVFKRADEKKTEGAADKAEKSSEAQAGAPVIKESPATIKQQSDGWFAIVDDTALVEVRMPAEPVYKEFTFTSVAGQPADTNHIHDTLVNKEHNVSYSWMDIHNPPKGKAKSVTATLDGMVKGAVINVFGELGSMTKIKSGKVPGREFDFTFPINTPDGKTHMLYVKSRIFIQGNRQYQVSVTSAQGKEDSAMTTKFFDSLIIKK